MLPIKIELPEGFLQEEVRCGYTVSAEVKKLWTVELDLLSEFDRVCKKNGLTYFADGGTLLGAVRHQGFIPWDDDIDVIMPRKDYDKLKYIAANEFRDPYFFQSMSSDVGLVSGGCRLRNSETTITNSSEWIKPFQNKGVFIDIFSLDRASDNDWSLRNLKFILKAYWRILRFAAYPEYYFEKDQKYPLNKRIKGLCAVIAKKIWGIERLYYGYEKCCTKYNKKDTKRVAPFESLRGHRLYQQKWFETTEYLPFEWLKIPVPANYDAVLKEAYGDYMVMKQVPAIHSALTFDAEMPYKEYRKKRGLL